MTPLIRSVRGLSAAGFHRISYREWLPPATAGRTPATVVCVHGLTRNGRDFDALAANLVSHNYRVICPDVVGRGESDRLSDPMTYGFPQYLSDMTALLARLDVETVDWIGTSMGALIGMLLAAQPGSPIRSLALNDAGPLIPRAALERIAAYVGMNPLFEDFAAAEAFARATHAGFGNLTDAQWRRLTEAGVRPEGDGRYRLNYDPAIAEPFRAQAVEDVVLWPVWDAIACPTLVLRGENSDLLLEDTAREMTRRGPEAELVTIPDCGHAPALMDEHQITTLQHWLDRMDWPVSGRD
jgi:pimeloyl-ACP methyl ester carboxylesterase